MILLNLRTGDHFKLMYAMDQWSIDVIDFPNHFLLASVNTVDPYRDEQGIYYDRHVTRITEPPVTSQRWIEQYRLPTTTMVKRVDLTGDIL